MQQSQVALLQTIFTFLIFIAFTSNLCSQPTHKWKRTNPGGGGAFSTIEAGPTGQIIAGSDLSGAYFSWNFGQSWDVYGASRGITSTHVAGIGFHPTNQDIFFIGTDDGIFKSINGGGFFTQVLDSGYITDVFVAPSNDNIIYSTFHGEYNSPIGGIYKSTNAGNSFAKISTDLPAGLRLLELHVSPTNPNILFVLAGNGRFHCGPAELYKSTDGGIHWTQKASSLGSIMDVAMHPTNHNIVYLTTMNVDCAASLYYTDLDGDFYRSSDAGDSWSLQTMDRTGVIWIKRDQPTTIRMIDVREPWPWIPSGGTWRSTNSGQSWTQTSSGNWDGGYQSSLAWAYGSSYNGFCKTVGESMENPDVLLWTNPQWVFGTYDEGVNFTAMHTQETSQDFWQSTGFDNTVMNHIDVNAANAAIIYISYADLGVWRSIDRGLSWQSANTIAFTGNWQGFGGNSLTVRSDPNREAVVWAGMQGDFYQPAYLVKSNSYGASTSWVQSDAGIPASVTRISGLSLDVNSPVNNRTLFVTADGDVYKSQDDGVNWAVVLADGGLHFTAADQTNSDVVYAGGRSGFFRSLNGGTNWQNVGLPAMSGANAVDYFDFDYEGVSSIATDPADYQTVYVTAIGPNGGTYKSINAGNTWTQLYTNEHMRAVHVNPNNNDQIYAGSSSAFYAGGYKNNSEGVLFSDDAGMTWAQVNETMAWPFANCFAFDQATPNRVYVGSPGTGIQYAYVGGSLCAHQVEVIAPVTEPIYQAVETITTAGPITINNDLLFRANQSVELSDEFTVPISNEFTVVIGDCE